MVSRQGTYLGFVTGPGKEEKSWKKAEAKFLQRATLWGNQGAGLHIGIFAYNTFAVSVLTFLAQLERPPSGVRASEAKAIRNIAIGPGNWISCEDAWFLKEGYGQTKSCTSVFHMAKAAQFRVASTEKWTSNGVGVWTRSHALKQLLNAPDNPGAWHQWRDWYSRSHIIQLTDNLEELEREGITYQSVTKNILGSGSNQQGDDETAIAKIKRSLQHSAYSMIKKRSQPNFEYRFRARVARWKMEGVVAHTSIRILTRLRELNRLVAPRVQSAMFSTLWNRWCIPRRFQRRHLPEIRA